MFAQPRSDNGAVHPGEEHHCGLPSAPLHVSTGGRETEQPEWAEGGGWKSTGSRRAWHKTDSNNSGSNNNNNNANDIDNDNNNITFYSTLITEEAILNFDQRFSGEKLEWNFFLDENSAYFVPAATWDRSCGLRLSVVHAIGPN